MKKQEPKKRPGTATFYSDDFKKKVIAEYLNCDLTKKDLLKKYKIRHHGAIQAWMRKFGIEDPYARNAYNGLPSTNRMRNKNTGMSEQELEIHALSKRIKELEKRLEEEKIRSKMYARVIEIAENDLKLNIRKKPDTK